MNSFCIQLYRTLFEQGEVDLYQWHQTTLVSPIEFAVIVRDELGMGRMMLSEDHTSVSLTEYGRRWVETNAAELFAKKADEDWKNVPEEMKYNEDGLFGSFFDGADIQHLIDNIEIKEGGDGN